MCNGGVYGGCTVGKRKRRRIDKDRNADVATLGGREYGYSSCGSVDLDVDGGCIRDWLVRRIDGGCCFGLSGDGVVDGDCMGGGGVILAGETDGANGVKWANWVKWAY